MDATKEPEQEQQPQPEVSAAVAENQTPMEAVASEASPSVDAEKPQIPLKKALESLLFITDHPLTLAQLCKLAGVPQKQSKIVTGAIDEIRAELEERGSAVQLVEVADGFQMGTRPNYAPVVKKLYSEKMTMRLSTAAHETLAIIAYKQPLTRAEIEQIRGVEVIAALETLLEKRLIEVVGRRETVGRPLMYGTTQDFLRHFGLRSLEDLPAIDSFVVENAPLGEQAQAPAAEVPAEAAAPQPAADKPLPSCVEAQAKEFAAGEQMAEEAAEQAAETAAEESSRKTIWDEK